MTWTGQIRVGKPSITDKSIIISRRLFLVFDALLHLLTPPDIYTTSSSGSGLQLKSVTFTSDAYYVNTEKLAA